MLVRQPRNLLVFKAGASGTGWRLRSLGVSLGIFSGMVQHLFFFFYFCFQDVTKHSSHLLDCLSCKRMKTNLLIGNYETEENISFIKVDYAFSFC